MKQEKDKKEERREIAVELNVSEAVALTKLLMQVETIKGRLAESEAKVNEMGSTLVTKYQPSPDAEFSRVNIDEGELVFMVPKLKEDD